MSDSNTLTVTHNAGFFSCCHIRLEKIIEFYNNYGNLPERIDGSKQFAKYKTEEMTGRDTTLDYFLAKPVSEFLEVERNLTKNINFIKKEFQNVEAQFSNYKHINFEGILPIFQHYFCLVITRCVTSVRCGICRLNPDSPPPSLSSLQCPQFLFSSGFAVFVSKPRR
jgi:hypothetical protein